jgi:hypothetical protein
MRDPGHELPYVDRSGADDIPNIGGSELVGSLLICLNWQRLPRCPTLELHPVGTQSCASQGVRYEERGPAVTQRSRQRRTAKMIRELRLLGYRIEPASVQLTNPA